MSDSDEDLLHDTSHMAALGGEYVMYVDDFDKPKEEAPVLPASPVPVKKIKVPSSTNSWLASSQGSAEDSGSSSDGSSEDYDREVVWIKFGKEWWPGFKGEPTLDLEDQAPSGATIFVTFFGKSREHYWAKDHELKPFSENREEYTSAAAGKYTKKKRFQTALTMADAFVLKATSGVRKKRRENLSDCDGSSRQSSSCSSSGASLTSPSQGYSQSSDAVSDSQPSTQSSTGANEEPHSKMCNRFKSCMNQ